MIYTVSYEMLSGSAILEAPFWDGDAAYDELMIDANDLSTPAGTKIQADEAIELASRYARKIALNKIDAELLRVVVTNEDSEVIGSLFIQPALVITGADRANIRQTVIASIEADLRVNGVTA